MKNISEILSLIDLNYYQYSEELNGLQFCENTIVSTLYQQKELIKIIGILDKHNITYCVDEKYNIIL